MSALKSAIVRDLVVVDLFPSVLTKIPFMCDGKLGHEQDLGNSNFVIQAGTAFNLKLNPRLAANKSVEALKDPVKKKLAVFELQKTTLLVRRDCNFSATFAQLLLLQV